MRTTLALLLAFVFVTACGGKGAPGKTAEDSQRSESAVREVLADYSKSFVHGDAAAACALMTPENQAEMVKALLVLGSEPNCKSAMKKTMAMGESMGADYATWTVGKKVEVSGNTATGVINASPKNITYNLKWATDRWLIAGQGPVVTKVDTDRWLTNWCKVQPNMTVDAAVKLMGMATDDLSDNGDSPQVGWDHGGYSFRAFLDTNDRIYQLDFDEDRLGDEDKAKVQCGSARR